MVVPFNEMGKDSKTFGVREIRSSVLYVLHTSSGDVK